MPTGGKNLYSTNQHGAPTRKQLRSFGFIVATGFLIIGLWPLIFRNQSPHRWARAVTVIFGLAALLAPKALNQAYRIWMKVGEVLGRINSVIILSGLYYLLLTPTKLFMKLAGYDPMNRSVDGKISTYRVTRKSRPVSHMTHQF
jgi:hypothetical protein